jgi:hypothetical protein
MREMFGKRFCIKTVRYVLAIRRGYKTMEQQNIPNQPSFIVGVALFFTIIVVCSIPVVIQQMYRPEKLLPHTNSWIITTRSTDKSIWEASDGTSADDVNTNRTAHGVDVIVQSTELIIRDAFYSEGLITKDPFKLSADIKIPISCHSGLVFRGNTQGEYYLFMIGQCDNTYTVEILQRKSGYDLPREAIIPNTKIPDKIGEPHTLTIIGNRTSYYFYINGVYVNQITDSRLNGNRVGIEILKCAGPSDEITFDFNNFALSSPKWQLESILLTP